MNTKEINFSSHQCANFIVKDNDAYIVDIIVDMDEKARGFIFNIIDSDSKEDLVCPLFQSNKQGLKFLSKNYDGFIYKNNKPDVTDRLTLVFTDMKAALLHFIVSHLEENQMEEKVVYEVVEDLITDEFKKWMKDRSLDDVLENALGTLNTFKKLNKTK